MDTVFDVLSIDRNRVKWEDYLYKLTPVEYKTGVCEIDGMFQEVELWFKRDDKFAPLGYGGINGSKLRQLIWLVSSHDGDPLLIGGTSIKSPQIPMSSIVARHYGMDSIQIIGATKPNTALKRDTVYVANWAGAKFIIEKVGYNPFLQKKCKELWKKKYPRAFYLEYGITVDQSCNPPERIEQFHSVGAYQVKNIPNKIKTLVMAMGSANSCISVIYGIFKYNIPIERIILVDVGHSRLGWMLERLKIIKEVSGVDVLNLSPRFVGNEKEEQRWNEEGVKAGDVVFVHVESGYDYQQDEKGSFADIEFHPTYEGKVWKVVRERLSDIVFANGDETLFWIVGSFPRVSAMKPILEKEIGPPPKQMRLYEAKEG